MQLSTILLFYGLFMLLFSILIALFMERSKDEPFGRIGLVCGFVATSFCCLEFTVLYLYLIDFFLKFHFDLIYFLMVWFVIAGIGCVISFRLFVKRQLLPVAVVILLMSYLMIGLGVMMKYLGSM